MSKIKIQGSAAKAPQGSRFFRFDIKKIQNAAASGVGASPPLHEVGDGSDTTNVLLSLQVQR